MWAKGLLSRYYTMKKQATGIIFTYFKYTNIQTLPLFTY